MKQYLLIIIGISWTLSLSAQFWQMELPFIDHLRNNDSLKVERMKANLDGFLHESLREDVGFLAGKLNTFLIQKGDSLDAVVVRELEKMQEKMNTLKLNLRRMDTLIGEAEKTIIQRSAKVEGITKASVSIDDLEKQFYKQLETAEKTSKNIWKSLRKYSRHLTINKDKKSRDIVEEFLITYRDKVKQELKLDETIERHKIEIENQQIKVEELYKIVEDGRKVIDTLVMDQSSVVKENKKLKNEKTLLADTLRQGIKKLNSLKTQIGWTDKQLRENKDFIKQQNISIIRLSNKIEELKDQKSKLKENNSNLETGNKKLRTDKKKLIAENTRLTKENQSLMGELKAKDIIIFLLLLLSLATILYFRKKAQADTYLKELNHRVKNTFQEVAALLDWQAEEVSESNAQKALKEAVGRVEAAKMMYSHLYSEKQKQWNSINLKEYLQDLIIYLVSVHQFNYPDIEPYVDIEEVHVSVETGYPIGLIINELITNCFKHAFDKVRQPILGIGLNTKKGKMYLRVQDNGKGLPLSFFQNPSSFGLKLVRDLVKQNQGKIDHVKRQHGGTAIEISFPFKHL